LQEEEEERGGRATEAEARQVVRDIRKRRNAFRGREETTYLKIKGRADRAREQGYAVKKVLRLQREAAEAGERWRKVSALFRSYPEEVHFLRFCVPQGQVPRDAHLLRLCESLEARIRRGEKLYVFSGTGRGRAVVVAGALLARLYGAHPEHLLARLQLASEAAYRQVSRPQRPRPLLAPMAASEIAKALSMPRHETGGANSGTGAAAVS